MKYFFESSDCFNLASSTSSLIDNVACQLTHHVTQSTLDKYMYKHMIVCILIDSSNAFNIVYSEETIDLSTTPQ